MNKKGFVLLETLVVLLVTVVSMLGLFLTYSFVLKSLEQAKHYDNINDIYKLNVFYQSLIPNISAPDGYVKKTQFECERLFNDENCWPISSKFGFKYYIYTNRNIDDILADYDPEVLLNTDINYMKTLDKKYTYLIGVRIINDEYYYVSLKVGELE